MCSVTWNNTANFTKLCHDTFVDGMNRPVHGRVFEMNVTRNPGSKHSGPTNAMKSVSTRFQRCFAQTCRVELMEEQYLRDWYRHDPYVITGEVKMRSLHGPNGPIHKPPLDWKQWKQWKQLPLLPLVAIAIIFSLVVLFILLICCHKRKKYQKHSEKSSYKSKHMPLQQQPAQGDWNNVNSEMESLNNVRFTDRSNYVNRETQNQLSPASNPRLAPPSVNAPRSDSPSQMLQPSQVERDPPMKVYDSSLLTHAMQMQQELGDAGTQAVQQLQMNALMGLQQANLNMSQTQVLSTQGLLPTQQALPSMQNMRSQSMPPMQNMPPRPNLPQSESMFGTPMGGPYSALRGGPLGSGLGY